MTKQNHTSDGEPRPNAGDAAGDALRKFVERIERLEDEKSSIAADIKDVYAEAKGGGYDVKVLRKAIARRKLEREKVEAEDKLLDLYEHALGVFG